MKIIINAVYSTVEGPIHQDLKTTLSYFMPGYRYSDKYKGLCTTDRKCQHKSTCCSFKTQCKDKKFTRKGKRKLILCNSGSSCKSQVRKCDSYDYCQYRKRLWDGRVYLLNKNVFPTGLLSKVEKFCKDKKIKYEIEDNRVFKKGTPYKLSDDFKAWEHQNTALKVCLEKKNGILSIATSGGKTNIAAMIIADLGLPTIFLTHLTGLLYQSQKRLESLLGCEVGIVGDSVFDPRKITVASIQTIDRHVTNGKDLSWLNDYKVMICDEVHHLSSTSWTTVCKSIDAPWRFGLSGTISLEGNGMLLEAYTGPILNTINLEYLAENNLVSPFSVKIININKPTVNKIKYPDVYDMGIVNNKDRNKIICSFAKLYSQKGNPVLILFRFIKHGILLCEMLKEMGLDYRFVYQKTSSEERIKVKEEVENGECKILVASSIFDEGENLPSVSALILAGGEKGGVEGRRLLQRIGRVLRLAEGKDSATIIDFYDDTHRYLKDHSDQRIQVYKDNNIKHRFL